MKDQKIDKKKLMPLNVKSIMSVLLCVCVRQKRFSSEETHVDMIGLRTTLGL